MVKLVVGLAAVGVVAYCVVSATDGINEKLAAVRNAQAAKLDPNRPGVIPPGDEPTLHPFEDPLGFFRVMVPGTPEATAHLTIPVAGSFGWHDMRVRVLDAAHFEQRFAGRLETGQESFSDPLID